MQEIIFLSPTENGNITVSDINKKLVTGGKVVSVTPQFVAIATGSPYK